MGFVDCDYRKKYFRLGNVRYTNRRWICLNGQLINTYDVVVSGLNLSDESYGSKYLETFLSCLQKHKYEEVTSELAGKTVLKPFFFSGIRAKVCSISKQMLISVYFFTLQVYY